MLTIKNDEVVVGDIVVYKKGSIIPADIRITNCDALTVIEGAVTEDSNIVEKYSAKLLENDLALTEIKNSWLCFRKNLLLDSILLGLITFLGFYFSKSIESIA